MESPSIAVVVLDTIRADTFSRYFEWVPGVRFTNAYSTSHWTVPAHASLLTGLYASEVGVHGKSRSFDYPGETIVEALQRTGYSTRLWTANIQIHAWEGWDRGFDEVIGPGNLRLDADRSVDWDAFSAAVDLDGPSGYAKAIWYALAAREGTFASLKEGYLKRTEGPGERGAAKVLNRVQQTDFGEAEFLLLNLMEAHTPHYPPRPFRTFDEEIDFRIGDAFAGLIEHPDRNRRAYDDSAAYLSSVYEELFEGLTDDFDVIITLSDHGELLGEYDMWNHGYGIYPQLAHIPLVVWCNGSTDLPDGPVRDDVASMIDVPQTIAQATDTAYDSRGRDLFSNTDSVSRLVEYHGFLPWHREQLERKGAGDVFRSHDTDLNGLVRNDGTYVFETHDCGLLSSTEDPRPEDETALADLVSTLSKRSVTHEDTTVSPAVRRRLEELGYA